MTDQSTAEKETTKSEGRSIGWIEDATPMGRVFTMRFPDGIDRMTLIGRSGDSLKFRYSDGGQSECTVNGWNEEGNADGNVSMVIGYADPDGTRVGNFDPPPDAKSSRESDEDDEDDDEETEPEATPAKSSDPSIPTIPQELLDELNAANKAYNEAALQHHGAAEIAKALKKELDAAQERQNRAVDAITNPKSPLPLVKEMEKSAESGDATDDEAWRTVRLDSLTGPEISARYIKAMAEHEPPIHTMGDLTDWQELKKDFWAKDIKGLGKAGQDEIAGATMMFWDRRDKAKKKAAAKYTFPSAESLIDDGQCDGTCGHEAFAEELEAMLADDRYKDAFMFLSEVLYWVEENQHCTKKQKQAVENIKSSFTD
jgi:hypothetical protein